MARLNNDEIDEAIELDGTDPSDTAEVNEFDELIDLAGDVSDMDAMLEEESAEDETPPTGVEDETPPSDEAVVAEVEEVQDDPTPPIVPAVVEEEVKEQPTAEQRTEEINVARQKWQDELTGTYQLTEEEAEQFTLEPEKVVPKLAAMIHSRVVTEALQTVAENMQAYIQQALQNAPNIVSSAVTADTARQEAVTQFYTAFPDLKAHEARVMDVVKMVKAAPENKNLTREELIVKAGNATRAMLGLNTPAAAAPAAPAQKPFIPAKPGAASGAVPQNADSEWDEIIATELI